MAPMCIAQRLVWLLVAALAACTANPNAPINQTTPIRQMDRFFGGGPRPAPPPPPAVYHEQSVPPPPPYTQTPGYAPAYPPYDEAMGQ